MAAFHEDVHSVRKFRLGTRTKDIQGNEYIYLKGVASTVAGDWVVYDEAFATIRMVTTSIGPVGIAKAATEANKFGWYLIKGSGSGSALTAYADNAHVNATATDGSVDDNSLTAAEIQVFGAWGRSAVNETTLKATFQVNYPYKSAQTLD
jgi:hypothetical protein